MDTVKRNIYICVQRATGQVKWEKIGKKKGK